MASSTSSRARTESPMATPANLLPGERSMMALVPVLPGVCGGACTRGDVGAFTSRETRAWGNPAKTVVRELPPGNEGKSVLCGDLGKSLAKSPGLWMTSGGSGVGIGRGVGRGGGGGSGVGGMLYSGTNGSLRNCSEATN